MKEMSTAGDKGEGKCRTVFEGKIKDRLRGEERFEQRLLLR